MTSLPPDPSSGAATHARPAPGVRATIACILWTLGTGVVLGIKAARPGWGVETLPMQVLQPLHTLGAMGLLVCGIATLTPMAIGRAGGRSGVLSRLTAPSMLVFQVTASWAIVAGRGSGLEYLTWPTALTALPFAMLVCVAWQVCRNLARLSALSAEGTWLLLMGSCLAPLGMIERAAGAGTPDITRALMIEWHSLDMVFAGFNTSLYGLGILLSSAPGQGRALRGRWLYVLAVFALLSTFGHHHYVSAQPMTLKLIALTASMLGLVSFLRHLAMVRRAIACPGDGGGEPLVFSAGLWTTFAVGSGVLLAVPQVNQLLHGTLAIVGHSMGAIIGVNVTIILGAILAAGQGCDTRRAASARRTCMVLNVVLALLVADLVLAGIAKGALRTSQTHHGYQPVVRQILTPLPLLGAALSAAIGRLCVLAWRVPARCDADRSGPSHSAASASSSASSPAPPLLTAVST